jgi:SHS2 domain-containing protein
VSFREIPHTADIGIEVEAESLDELFKEAVLALYSVMFSDKPSGDGEDCALSLEGTDGLDLAIVWLNELIYIYDAKGKTFLPSVVSVDEGTWRLESQGKLIPPPKRKRDVKAATFGGAHFTCLPRPYFRVFLDV